MDILPDIHTIGAVETCGYGQETPTYGEVGMPLPYPKEEKIYFEEEGHVYALVVRNEEGSFAYRNYIVTSSSFIKYISAMVDGSINTEESLKNFFPIYDDTPFVSQFPDLFSQCVIKSDGSAPYIPEDTHARAMAIGTFFHWVAEHMILYGRNGMDPRNVIKRITHTDGFEICKVSIDNLIQLFQTFGYGYFSKTELQVGSFKHRVCGSIDAIHIDPVSGVYTIFDWKYSKTLANDLFRFKLEKNQEITPGVFSDIYIPDRLMRSSLKGYVVQLAVYKKLLEENNITVSNVAYLLVFAAINNGANAIKSVIKIDLSLPGFMTETDTPISLVQKAFDDRIQRLSAGINKPLTN